MKVRVNVSLDERYVLLAKRLDMNLSFICNEALSRAVSSSLDTGGRCPLCSDVIRSPFRIVASLFVCRSCFLSVDPRVLSSAMSLSEEKALALLRQGRKEDVKNGLPSSSSLSD